MSSLDVVDPRYAESRRVLLDALFALAPHGKAVIVVGAQAVYLRTGEADLAIAPYTTDGDLAINPSLLGDDPLLEEAMKNANFSLLVRPEGHTEPGIWVSPATIDGKTELIPVDLIVPEGVAPSGGRRGACLGAHGKQAAGRAVGVEAALVDHSSMVIGALDRTDTRSIEVEVAGPAALLVAKAHKIHDRVVSGKIDRIGDKDAADVFRLMQTTQAKGIATTLSMLTSDQIAGATTGQAIIYLDELFGRRARPGIEMASRALRLAMDADTITVICTAYVSGIIDAMRKNG